MRLFRWLATFMAALAAGIIGVFVVLPFGLVVHELVILPLALLIGALFSALGASWASSLLARDQTRARIVPVLVAAAIGAALIALILALLYVADATRPANILPPPGVQGLAASLALAFATTLAAGRFRGTQRETASQGRLMAALIVVAVISVPAVIFVAALLGLTGA